LLPPSIQKQSFTTGLELYFRSKERGRTFCSLIGRNKRGLLSPPAARYNGFEDFRGHHLRVKKGFRVQFVGKQCEA
jgi:hypothetical protein